MLEPDATTRAPATHPSPPRSALRPEALQILTTEHWSLLAGRSLVYTEAIGRASMFIAALSGSVVALALVSQATDFGTGFIAFALVLLPVVFGLGLSTVARLAQVNWEDAMWVAGMNRIRHAYLELAPELAPYFVTGRHDDESGILLTSVARPGPVPRTQPFVALPGLVALLDSVVAGAIAGVVGLGLDLGTAGALALGCLGFLLSVLGFFVWATRRIRSELGQWQPVFPSPPRDATR